VGSTFHRLLGLVVVSAGCSEVMVVPEDGTGGSSSDGAGEPSSTTTGVASSTSSFGTSSSVTTSGQGGGAEVICPIVLDEGFYVTVTVDGTTHYMAMPCIGDEAYNAPTGAFGGGGECARATLIHACGTSDIPEDSTTIVFSTPLAGRGTAPAEGIFEDMPFEDIDVTITHYGEVNGTIGGWFAGTVSLPDRTTVEASGDFKVCRIPDTPPCP
jgi:hypothetical protein